jgi:3-oxoacyl-[acyl-carrier-protein] synthase-3
MNRYAHIVGTGSCAPQTVLTNLDLEQMVDTSDEWIISRTGIKKRHIADKNTAASVPIALDEAIKDGRIKKGDNILMVSFGAGFTWGSVIAEF